LTDQSQAHAIGEALVYAKQYMDGHHNMKMIVEQVFQDIASKGLTVIGNSKSGDYAMFRPQKLAAALNRLRSLIIQQ
jgi:methyltransferase-like protein